jgi:ABC-2 type transport system ATP-binding protein
MVTALRKNVRTARPIVKCVRVGTNYPGKVFRLSDISFEARLQTITAVVGRNGSGKTTLFNIIAGQKQHNEGQVYFPGLGMNGTELDWRELHLRLAYVPQELPRWRGSLRENIQYEAALHGLIGNENERETAFMIERLGLGDFVSHSWGDLSGGYKLRFALARALVWKPKLLLLDEPLANLDFETQQLLMRDLRHLADSARYPIAVILSSQHLHEIEPFVDQVMFLDKGMCKFCAPLDFLAARDSEALFEFNVGASLAELHQVFRNFPVADLSYQGANYLLRAPGAVKAAQVLDQFARFGVQVHYFRNLGRSIKSLFLK